MSKADILLQKAASFEKFSLYGDRQSFLKTLADSPLPDPDANLKWLATAGRSEILDLMSTMATNVGNTLWDFQEKQKISDKLDNAARMLMQLGKSISEKNIGDKTFGLLSYWSQVAADEVKSADIPEDTKKMPVELHEFVANALSRFKAISEERNKPQETKPEEAKPVAAPNALATIQTQLAAVLKAKNIAFQPIQPDGIMGPITRAGLDAFKSNVMKTDNPYMSDSDIFSAIRAEYSKLGAKPPVAKPAPVPAVAPANQPNAQTTTTTPKAASKTSNLLKLAEKYTSRYGK